MKIANIVRPPLMVILLCLITPALLRQNSVSTSSHPLPNEPAPAPATQGPGERGPVRMVRFVLLDSGLYPRVFRVNQGLINLALEDETGTSEGLVVERVVNSEREKVTTLRRLPNQRRGRELIRLIGGRYTLYDASKPNNKADLIVDP